MNISELLREEWKKAIRKPAHEGMAQAIVHSIKTLDFDQAVVLFALTESLILQSAAENREQVEEIVQEIEEEFGIDLS